MAWATAQMYNSTPVAFQKLKWPVCWLPDCGRTDAQLQCRRTLPSTKDAACCCDIIWAALATAGPAAASCHSKEPGWSFVRHP